MREIIGLFIVAVLSTSLATQAQPSIRHLGRAKVIAELSIEKSDPARIDFFRASAQELLTKAGYNLTGSQAQQADLMMRIRVKGIPMAARYRGKDKTLTFFTGAAISGSIILEKDGRQILKKDFLGTKNPDEHVFRLDGYGGCRKSSCAPYEEAAALPGSYFPALIMVVKDLGGEQALARAMGSKTDLLRKTVSTMLMESRNSSVADIIVDVIAKSPGRKIREDCWETLKGMGSAAVPAVARALAFDGKTVRSEALKLLSKVKDESLAETLVAALGRERDVVLSNQVSKMLQEIGGTKTVELLASLLLNEQKDFEIRKRAAWTLAKIGDPKAAEALVIFGAITKHPYANETAVSCLKKIGKPAVKNLESALGHKDVRVRSLAAAVLEELTLKKYSYKKAPEKKHPLDGIYQSVWTKYKPSKLFRLEIAVPKWRFTVFIKSGDRKVKHCSARGTFLEHKNKWGKLKTSFNTCGEHGWPDHIGRRSEGSTGAYIDWRKGPYLFEVFE